MTRAKHVALKAHLGRPALRKSGTAQRETIADFERARIQVAQLEQIGRAVAPIAAGAQSKREQSERSNPAQHGLRDGETHPAPLSASATNGTNKRSRPPKFWVDRRRRA